MMKHGFGLGAWVLAVALAACGDGGGDTGPTLGGIDANTNGVRDDIERHIEKKYTVPAQRKAAMQTARALQQTLLVNTNDVQALDSVSQMGMHAANCRGLIFPGLEGLKEVSHMSDEIEALTTNTKERRRAYLAYNKAVSGTVSQLPKGNTCNERSDEMRLPS